MKRILFATVMIAICVFMASCQSESVAEYSQIEDFEVLDNPYDDGSGVILSWKPLPREERIIQYRVYRGISADSLFLLGSIDVDPALGVIGDKLYFYDKDYQVFFDLESAPAKLRKEKTQMEDSPLYGPIPRDPKVLATLIPHFSVLGAIKNSNFYYKSQKYESDEGDLFAGYRVNQFDNMYANPMAGTKYYYTVLAVNERGRLLPHAGIQDIEPVDNRPDSTAVIHTSVVPETGVWNFEWTPPVNSQDIYTWEAWLLPKTALGEFYAEQAKMASGDISQNFTSWQSRASQLFMVPNDLSHSIPVYYHSMEEGPAQINLNDYKVVIGYSDFSGLQAFNVGRPIRSLGSDEIPTLPQFTVQDKKNDKGDANIISIGKPIAFVSQAAYTDKARRKMMINYDLADNANYKISSIVFEVYNKNNELIGEATEHFIDKVVRFHFPEEHRDLHDLNLSITVNFKNAAQDEASLTTQKLSFDDRYRRFVSGDVYYLGQNLSKRYYDIASLTKLDLDYFPGKRTTAMTRLYDDIIAYEDMLYKPIYGGDDKTGLLLLDPNILIEANTELMDYYSAPIYRDEYEKRHATLKEEIDGITLEAAKYSADAVPDSIAMLLAHQKAKYDYIQSHPAHLKASSARSDKAWLKTLVKQRQENARTFAYKMRVTDGKGAVNTSEPFLDEEGNIWHFPRPEWFDDTKIPTLIGSILLAFLVVFTIYLARRGKDLYIRPIAGLAELDNAVGRATEMGRPVMFVPGWGTLGDVCTIAAMMILNQVAKKTAEFDTRIISPNCDYFVVPLAQEMVKTAYSEIGRPDSFNQNDIYFVSDMQFAFSAAVNGITIRERVATIFYMGFFNAEALLMTETGNQCGAIQIAATDAITQIPFFITTCDYTLIGEEFYAASAYLSQDRDLVSMLKAQDYFKVVIVAVVTIGAILSTFHYNALINLMPLE